MRLMLVHTHTWWPCPSSSMWFTEMEQLESYLPLVQVNCLLHHILCVQDSDQLPDLTSGARLVSGLQADGVQLRDQQVAHGHHLHLGPLPLPHHLQPHRPQEVPCTTLLQGHDKGKFFQSERVLGHDFISLRMNDVSTDVFTRKDNTITITGKGTFVTFDIGFALHRSWPHSPSYNVCSWDICRVQLQ